MSNNNSQSVSGGIGFAGLLAIVFITLKLCNVIQWSWLWVLAPIWIPAAIVLAILIIFLLCAFIGALFSKPKRRRW